MKLIFLDIDGVLNKKELRSNIDYTDVIRHDIYGSMYKSLIERLNEITDETGAKIVLSSGWRCETLEESQAMLKLFGISGEVVGQTPHLGEHCVRGNEILAWLTENKELLGYNRHNFKQYIIIDDESDLLLEQAEHFVHVEPCSGLSDTVQYRAVRKLNMLRNIDS